MKHLLLAFSLFLMTGTLMASSDHGPSAFWQYDRNDYSAIRIFPNPAIDYIEVSINDQVRQVTVFNLAGRRVKSFTYGNGEKYFIGNLPRGMYLVQLTGERHNVLSTQRINLR